MLLSVRKIPTLATGLGIVLGLAVVAAPTVLRAGGLPRAVPLAGLRVQKGKILPGTWARYSYFDTRRSTVALLRLAALERVGKAQWFEVAIKVGAGAMLVFRSLVEGAFDQPKRVLQTIVQPPGQMPLILPKSWAGKRLPKLARGTPGKLLGKAKLRVAAGTFVARHYRRKTPKGIEDAWLSDAVPGWPLLRFHSPKVRLELLAYGNGARSYIVGKPIKLDPRLLQRK